MQSKQKTNEMFTFAFRKLIKNIDIYLEFLMWSLDT